MAKRIGASALQFAFFGIVFTAGRLLFDYTLGTTLKPATEYWVFGFISGGVWWFIDLATRQGWLRGVFRDPGPDLVLEERRKKLADERQRAIDEALVRKSV